MVSTYSANVKRPPGFSEYSMGPLVLLQLFILLHSGDAITRTFYIAAVEQFWNYKEGTVSSLGQREIVRSTGAPIYKKAIYMEYGDASFTDPKPREPWTGLLGPIIRLETFDSAVIHFKNLASIPYSLHGIGVSYTKRSEGAGYEDGTNKLEKADDAIPPGQEYIYTWNIPEGYGPVESDPPCITSAYHSHSNTSYDINSGLVGILLICKPGSLSEDGSQYGVQEKIITLAVFDERLSHYNHGFEDTPLHTINGFINGSIPEQTMCVKKPAYFHVIGFGTHVEVHRFSLEGHSFVIGEHRVPILPVTAFSFFTAVVNPGEKEVYKLSCQTRTHPEGRMTSLVRVEECIREPKTRSHVPDDDDYEEEDDYYESTVLDMADDSGHVDPRSHSKRNPVIWEHYIAAIEVDWDYQPTRNDKRNRFTKVLYREFTNSKFTHQKPSEIPGMGILGPVLRGEVGDQIRIVFKNLARHPFNLYPQGLSSVSSNQPSMAGEQLRDYPIYPNDSITYIWQVTTYDSPASSDPRCLTRFYASFHNLQKDLASGLIGPLLICSKQTLDRAGNQIITDKENILFFCIFNETLSWYHEENRQQSAVTLSEDMGAIGKSPGLNLIYTINGILDSLQLSICQNEVSVWHVLNLGLGTKLISIYFGGNTFMVDSSYQETLTLIPMNGKTVIMVMEKTGQWNVAPDSLLADLGMRATLRVSRCEHHQDDYYEYDHDESKDFTHDPAFYQFPFIAPFKNPPSGPRSYLKKSPTPEYLNDGILNDESLKDSTKSLQPVGSNEIQSDDKVKGKPVKELRRQRRDATGQTSPANKQLKNRSHSNMVADNVDFYDDYSSGDFEYIDLYGEQDPRSHVEQIHTYFIAAEEIEWDYGGGQSPYFIKDGHRMLHGFPSYKKVVFREYLDSSFNEPAFRGERDAHLGLLGPCIRAEVNDEIIIQFKNMASRPYSFYSNVLAVQWKEEDSVPPQHTRTYTGKVSSQFGPTGSEECRTWFYTSNGHLYKDFHSGLIGPLLVCRPNVLKRSTVQQISMEDFSLVFMEMDEMKSWYFRENWQRHCPSTCGFQANVLHSCPQACKSPSAAEDIQHDHIFHAINGYVDDSLPGLVLPLDRKTRWHLLNIGRRDILPVQFHGNILKQGSQKDHPCSIVNLYPGVGVTLEMTAQTTGLWLIEPEGEYNNHNMTALYLVYNPRCHQPLGLLSGKIKDLQITASGHYGSWVPSLARLGNSGTINAWSVDSWNSWIQVDLLAPMVIHAIQTQGARQKLLTLYISQYIVFYSLNGEKWSQYQGNTSSNQMVFFGNVDASSIRENSFNPPIIARFIRIHPVHTGSRAGLRMELFGCDLTSCSMSLGMESGTIIPYQLSASTSLHSVFSSWVPNLARLKQQGRINAWRPQADRPGEWYQVDLGREMKVTGIMIQGARSFSSMYITEFSLSFSNDGLRWTAVQSSNGQRQIFPGNKDSDTLMWVTMESPVIARFLKLHPEKWKGGIALRMEVLGCGV